jgi:Asp-tRNA(Asn)/Glu-tRNA(Gln) amidotransferase C subunit
MDITEQRIEQAKAKLKKISAQMRQVEAHKSQGLVQPLICAFKYGVRLRSDEHTA